MTHYVPEHLVRPEWVAGGLEVALTCTRTGCGWRGRVGYPSASPLDLTPETQRDIYRSVLQAASVHGWPDLDHLPADGILARRGDCDCPPDPTASPSFWARIRGAIG